MFEFSRQFWGLVGIFTHTHTLETFIQTQEKFRRSVVFKTQQKISQTSSICFVAFVILFVYFS